MNIFLFPSFYAHIFNGILLFIGLILIALNYSKLIKIETYKIIMIVLVFSIAIGIHGLSHLGLEYIYNFNPLSAQ